MKKILALLLSSILVISCASVLAACSGGPVQENLYFVPGTYVADGERVENGLPKGGTKLTDEECAEMNTENVYRCKLRAGKKMPKPTTQRKDKDDNAYTFNGWWTIVNATVTYYDRVPTVTETTFLYADWRADLSQRKDPVIPEPGQEKVPDHYIMLTHEGEAEAERVTIRHKSTDMMSAEDLGYGYPVELYIQGLELKPGDKFTVYTKGLVDSDKAEEAPVLDEKEKRSITLDASGDGSNDTADYLQVPVLSHYSVQPEITYLGTEAGLYNMYIKFYSGGSVMAVYLEPMA